MLLHRLLALGLCAAMTAPSFAAAPARKDLLGDPLPEGAISRMGSGRLRSLTNIYSLSFTPDGKFLVSGGESNKLTFWSVATGKIDKEWTLGSWNAIAIHFDKAGKTVAVSTNDSRVRILDGETGKERREMIDPTRRFGSVTIRLSPDGKWFVMNHRDNRQIVIFDVETGVLKHRITNINSYNRPEVVFTPDSKQFVSLWTDNKLHLVDLATGKSVRGLETGAVGDEVKTRTGNSTRITATALSSDGKQLFYRSYSNRHFYVANVADGKLVKKFERVNGYSAATGNMALTPNDRFLIDSISNESIRVYGVASGKMLRKFSPPNTGFYSAIVSPDGKLVATAYTTAIYLWDVATGKQLHAYSGHTGFVRHLAFSPDGKSLVSTGLISMRVWESATGKERAVFHSKFGGGNACDVQIAPDNQSIRWINNDRALYRWRFATEREPVRVTTPKVINGAFSEQATSPDGKFFATFTGTDGRVRLLDNLGKGPNRELGRLPAKQSATFHFSPDGGTLAVASSDRSVTLYDVATGNEMRKLMPNPSNTSYNGKLLQFSPDGRMLLQYDGEMRVVETISGGDRALLSREPSEVPSSMNWSADGRLVARGFADGTAVVTDLWTGRDVFRRQTGQAELKALCLSRDSKYLATGGSNTTAMVWELPPPKKLTRVASMTDESAWGDLGHQDASRAHRAMLHLIASPDDTVRLLAKRLEPRPPVEAGHIDRLVADLDDGDFKVRERATRELLDIGTPAAAALKKATRSTTLEVKRRATDLLSRIEPGTTIAPERLRALRAIEVLERIGTPAARTVLEAMLKAKFAAPVEVSVRDALARMTR